MAKQADLTVTDESPVLDWEDGIPTGDDLTPLTTNLIPPLLSSAFQIPPPDLKTILDVHRASQQTILTLTAGDHTSPIPDEQKTLSIPDAEDPDNRALKRPRLVWSPQLHKRFVDVVTHLGINNAVPKTIMQMMNVEGLTRENVASHLQKYRLYLKRIQGFSNEGFSSAEKMYRGFVAADSDAYGAGNLSGDLNFESVVPFRNVSHSYK